MKSFFPIPMNINGLFVAPSPEVMTRRPERNIARFHEIAAERDYARLVVGKWVAAAIEDGWTRTPTYAHEEVSTACTLQRDNFKCLCIMRVNEFEPRWTLGVSEINCWAPDKLQIPVPLEYPGWQYFVDAPTTCPHCHRGPNRYMFEAPTADGIALSRPVATARYHFAGRACDECRPALVAKTEKPGWCD